MKCPEFNTNCAPAHTRFTPDGCCRVCIKCRDGTGAELEVGSQWKKDNCTTCTCSGLFTPLAVQKQQIYPLFIHIETGEVDCTTKVCERKVCSVGYRAEPVLGSRDECCPLQECMPTSLPYSGSCPAPLEPDCAPDQELRRIVGTDNCPTFVCGKGVDLRERIRPGNPQVCPCLLISKVCTHRLPNNVTSDQHTSNRAAGYRRISEETWIQMKKDYIAKYSVLSYGLNLLLKH